MPVSLNKKQVIARLMRIGFALGVSFLLLQFPLYQWEFAGYDLLFRAKPSFQTQSEIIVVNIDRKTIEELRHEPDIADHNLFIQSLKKLNPKGVLYLMNPAELVGTAKQQAAFARSADEINNFIVSIEDVPIAGAENKFKLSPPLHHLNLQPGILSKDSRNFAGDNVSRRALVFYEGRYFAQAQLAQLVAPVDKPEDYQGIFSFKGSHQVFVNLKRPKSFKHLSFIDIIDQNFDAEELKNKIIIVGQDAQAEANNYVMTPYLRDVTAMSKAEFNANIIHTLIKNNAIIQAPEWLRAIVTIIMAIITVFITFTFRPVRGILTLLALGSSYFIVSLACFSLEFWLPLAHPFLALFVGYYLLIPFRLVQENKKSWEYQQRNKLLTQVEELKNNFISMMSHDLKTPLARIQGMAEMALNDQHPLSQQQNEAINTISKSSVELTQFVNSILNFGRLESEGVSLNLETKDLNSIIESIVKKYKYLAQEKNIEVITELEPLFATPVDADLIQQVIQNLIENAIKYSREGGKVLVTTEEIDGKIQIQVSDQGLGIEQDEIDKVFMKFYRSKNAKSSPIKGTGLGLYLTKYFVELHKGEIQVDSVVNSGSTFTVKLPTDLDI
jgi:signal transduction histidine kinase